jgi:Xaa-Pro dipeptidase
VSIKSKSLLACYQFHSFWVQGMEMFNTDLELLHPVLSECRVHKSKLELDVLRYANNVSSEAHVQVMRIAKVGMKEYQLESTFLHHVYMYGGCRYCSYPCICAAGENSSTLHYGHAAAPNDKVMLDGDMALLDMGAEYHCYGSDITCSFPVSGFCVKCCNFGFAQCSTCKVLHVKLEICYF